MMASTSESPPHVRNFQANDLIWAKMKGFPPWPAKVLNSNSEPSTSDIPAGRISVMFYGTKETAFMKPSDLFPYMENRHQFEVPRKHKGFNEGVNEIRQSAGLEVDPLFTGDAEVIAPPRSPPPRTHRSSNGSKLFQDVFLSGFDRNRTKSFTSGKARSRTSSSASLMKTLMQNMKKERSRLNSESSTGSKRRRHQLSESEEQRLVLDAFDSLNPLADYDPALLDMDDDNRSKRSRGSSRVFEEYMLSANRLRTRSGSEGRRSRLISGVSGVSDVFDELYDQAQNLFTHDGLMDALDNLQSEGSSGVGGDRARTPEAPLAPLAGTVKFCSDCGCECQPHNKQWRCTSKFCLKINGPVESEHHHHHRGGDNHNNHHQQRDYRGDHRGGDNRPSTSQAGSSSSMMMQQQQQPSTSRYNHHPHLDHVPRKVARVQPPPPVPNPPAGPSSSRLAKEEKKVEEEDEEDDERMDEGGGRGRDDRDRRMGGPGLGMMRTSRRDDFNMSSLDEPSPGRIKRKTVRISPPPPPVRSPTRRGAARPMKYALYSKVEKTPPVSENGLRNCLFCGGQVRPQMCGGNKHSPYRWRCVDKKCRKWYGWVKQHDEIPKDLNKKNLGASPDKSSGPGSVDNSPVPEKKRLGRPPKHQGLKIRLGNTKKELEAARPKRKYTKRKDREAAAAAEGILLGPDGKKLPKAARALSPLTQREASFRPSTLQRRSRWWTAEKRRNDYSPPRQINGDVLDAAASFRLISQAMRACSVTASNSTGEPGTVAGAMDLLMDSLCSSMAPLLSLLNQFPRFAPNEETNASLWDSSLPHTPIFQ